WCPQLQLGLSPLCLGSLRAEATAGSAGGAESQKIVFHGYPSELYEVMTEDGYFLTVNRIPHGRRDRSGIPVLIVHGFCQDGGDWVDNFPDSSLAFILADAGYDVWLGNNRGNSWSRRHQNLSVDSVEFWDFSFHEMAMYDLPAMVGFILMQTEQEKLFYVGHAQGNTLGFIAFSSLPHLAKKIKLFFALAPVSTLRYARGPVLRTGLLPDVFSRYRRCLCTVNPEIQGRFQQLWTLCISRLDVYLSHFPDYTSVKNLLHWGQGCSSPSQPTPPFYKIEDMKVPVALWSGGRDWVKHFPEWNHFDYHWGLNAPQRLYMQMVTLMNENP
uniref:Partial AB-hydrolase lipase domain-containing protein n=1 Tax=Malurus cyaneus samueli TaxID=2593467 RepID=A0A8C5TX45_9PASS